MFDAIFHTKSNNTWISQLRSDLEWRDLTMVTHALVTSKLDYCNALHLGLLLETSRKLQQVQNMAARMPQGAGRWGSALPLLKQPHWLPASFCTGDVL